MLEINTYLEKLYRGENLAYQEADTTAVILNLIQDPLEL